MFYSKSSVDNYLKCKICINRFDIPRVMPCGDVICEMCLNNLKNASNIVNRINCPFCNKKHSVPNDNFPIDKITLELLKIEPKTKFRGVLVEQLDDILHTLHNQLTTLNEFSKSVETKIHEHHNQLKNQIIQATNEKKSELKNLKENFYKKITSYEDVATDKIDTIVNQVLNENKAKIKVWNKLIENKDSSDINKLSQATSEIVSWMENINLNKNCINTLTENFEVSYFNDGKERIKSSIIGVLKLNDSEILPTKNEGNTENLSQTEINDLFSCLDDKNLNLAFKSLFNGKFICAENAGNDFLIANKDEPQLWESFQVEKVHNDVVAIKALVNSKYVNVASEWNPVLLASSDEIKSSDLFELVIVGANTVAFKSLVNCRYVSAQNGGYWPLIANEVQIGPSETFEIYYAHNEFTPQCTDFTSKLEVDKESASDKDIGFIEKSESDDESLFDRENIELIHEIPFYGNFDINKIPKARIYRSEPTECKTQ